MAYTNEELYNLTQGYGGNQNPSEGVDTFPGELDNSAGYALTTPGESRYYHTGLEHESQAAPGATIPQGPSLVDPGFPASPGDSLGVKSGQTTEQGGSVSRKFTPDAKISQRDRELKEAQKQADVQAGSYYKTGEAALEKSKTTGVEAVGAMVEAERAKTEEQGRQARVLGDMQKEWMEEEKKINLVTASKAEEAKADYLTSLMEYRAAGVNPSQIWDNMKGGTRFGTLVSVFAHDFLGAQGVKTSTMDTINRAIDRSIDAQIQGIKIKGEVTQGFKQLWDMQRQQSASDQEARTRVRGFMLESMKQGLVSEMSKYDSALVSARGKQALAKIDEEYAKNILDVNKHIAQNAVALRAQATSWAGDKVRADAEAYSASVRLKVAEMEDKRLREAAAAKSAFHKSDVIINPENNKGQWRFKEGVSDAEKAKVRDQIAGVAEVNAEINRLRELGRELNPNFMADIKPGSRLAPEDERKYEAIRIRLAHAMVKANGERATEKDIDQYLKSLPIDTTLTNGGVDSILAYTQKSAIMPAYYSIQQRADDIPLGEQTSGPTQKPFAGALADAAATDKSGGKLKKTDMDYAQSLLERPDKAGAMSAAELSAVNTKTTLNAKDEWKNFVVASLKDDPTFSDKQFDQDVKDRQSYTNIPNAAGGVIMLFSKAQAGDEKAKAALADLAGYNNDGHELPLSTDEKALRNFARYEYSKLK